MCELIFNEMFGDILHKVFGAVKYVKMINVVKIVYKMTF